jgi:putative hydrolase of the HAD superfamily
MTEKLAFILFDMDNVLCRYDRWRRAARLAEMSGTPARDIYRAIWESGFENLGDNGTLAPAEYLKAFGDRIGYKLTLDQWIDARRASIEPDTAMLAIVRRLRDLVDIAILTNNTELLVDHIDVVYPELRPLFGQRIYASAMFYAAKPDVVCFQRCLDKLEVRPDSVLFVDDLADNIAGAKKAGLHTHHFTSVDEFSKSIDHYGLGLRRRL